MEIRQVYRPSCEKKKARKKERKKERKCEILREKEGREREREKDKQRKRRCNFGLFFYVSTIDSDLIFVLCLRIPL